MTAKTVALWLVAEFEALSYQVKLNLNKSVNFETGTATAINYSACYVLVLFVFSSNLSSILKIRL